MTATMNTLESKLKEMTTAADAFKAKHQITAHDQQAAQEQEQDGERQGGQGVLI